ncbi:MAG TPA: isopentenyl-diphosphate Delta-isomerase [Actinomycetota bacterium]|nr:isopentenyl-diphosphate Delta-isomerase [Actinomycetota bacterium]
MATIEQVVLLDESGAAIGTAPKHTVHDANTPLHLAFSCYVVNAGGEVLLTRRAPGKRTWPDVWSNSCCGHPGPGEPFPRAIRRRLRAELGIAVGRLDPILPHFRYQAVMPDGTAENEVCPVFRAAALDGTAVRMNPDEVAEAHWVPWAELVALAADPSQAVSPWCRSQIEQLVLLGGDPRAWPAAAAESFPTFENPGGTVSTRR